MLVLIFQALEDFIVFKMAVILEYWVQAENRVSYRFYIKRNLQKLSVQNDKMRCPEVAEVAVLKESKVTRTAFLKTNIFEHLPQ